MTWGSIETERLLLRDWRESDTDGIFEMGRDEEWARYMYLFRTRAEAWRTVTHFVGHRELRGYSNWVVEEKETGEFVGRVGPWFPDGWPLVEIGWSIMRSRWGRGYALEAARAAAHWVHSELSLDEVCHLIHPENVKSQRVAEKLGAKPGERFTMPFPDGPEVVVWRTALPLGT